MRHFLAFSCMLAIAIAAPQYNYNAPQYASGTAPSVQYSFGSGLNGVSYTGGAYGGNAGSLGGGVAYGGSDYSGSVVSDHGAAFNSFNPAPALPSAASIQSYQKARPQPQRRVLPTIVTKNIYYHSAPEEPDEEIYEDNSSQQARKHYNVLFIKAPHQSIKKIATQTAQALNEERTAVYVLSKNNDIQEIRQAISETPLKPHKPEVFFIKYKTPEEAQHATQTIQAQYETIGGSTNVQNEGVAPVSSVVGVLDGGHGGGGGSFTTTGGGNSGLIGAGSGSGLVSTIGTGNGAGFVGTIGTANGAGLVGTVGTVDGSGLVGTVGTGNGVGTVITSSGGDNFISSGSGTTGTVQPSYLPPNKV